MFSTRLSLQEFIAVLLLEPLAVPDLQAYSLDVYNFKVPPHIGNLRLSSRIARRLIFRKTRKRQDHGEPN